MHLDSGGRSDVHANFYGIVEPDFVFDDLCLEPGGAEFLGHIVGRGLVFGRAGHVWGLRQGAKVFFRQLGIGHGQEAGFRRGFGGGVTETEDGLGIGRGRLIAPNNGPEGGKQNGRGEEHHEKESHGSAFIFIFVTKITIRCYNENYEASHHHLAG